MTIRVLLADDQALLRGTFRLLLDAHDDIEVVGEAVDGRQVLILTTFEVEQSVVEALRAGASGFLGKADCPVPGPTRAR
jgi:DNA-binding NarL/FixJ family response regulator